MNRIVQNVFDLRDLTVLNSRFSFRGRRQISDLKVNTQYVIKHLYRSSMQIDGRPTTVCLVCCELGHRHSFGRIVCDADVIQDLSLCPDNTMSTFVFELDSMYAYGVLWNSLRRMPLNTGLYGFVLRNRTFDDLRVPTNFNTGIGKNERFCIEKNLVLSFIVVDDFDERVAALSREPTINTKRQRTASNEADRCESPNSAVEIDVINETPK